MKPRSWLVLLLLVISSSALAAEAGKCVYPIADGGGEAPSKASLEGRIVRVEEGAIEIRLAGETKEPSVRVLIDEGTNLFTVYGGYVAREELAVGQDVHVRYVGCTPKEGATPRAAVVQLKSTKPAK